MDTLTQTHLVTLRNLLTYRLRDLQAEFAGETGAPVAAEAAGDVQDQKDAAARRQSMTIEAAEVERDATELAAVQAALKRLDENRYGDCVDCGNPIPMQRLLVQPAAVRCAAYQHLFEHAAARRSA